MSACILHISDLHRDPRLPLKNGPLLVSLVSAVDKLQKLTPSVPDPDLIVVSGDIVHGVPQDADSAKLPAQYEEAEAFLVALTDEFVGGQRQRVVIVPGNHDVSFPVFRSSLDSVDYQPDKWGTLVPSLFERESPYRWAWAERELYRIRDREIYLRRLEEFARFYTRFYQDERIFSLDPAEQVEIFDYEDLALTVVGYSSCNTNDPWHRLGDIHPEAISSSLRELRRPVYSGRALVAVWHHSISAPPRTMDFMDEERVQLLLTHGFTLGLHGHQHRPESIRRTSRFGIEGEMMVISAGTLCGGPEALPPGRSRSFNIVELDVERGEGRLHVQTMLNNELDSPIWGLKSRADGEKHTGFEIRPVEVAERARRNESLVIALKAQELIEAGALESAVALLLPVIDNVLFRRLLLEALTRLDDADTTIRILNPPKSDPERIHLMNAFWDSGDRDALEELLDSPGVADSSDPSVRSTRDTLLRKLEL